MAIPPNVVGARSRFFRRLPTTSFVRDTAKGPDRLPREPVAFDRETMQLSIGDRTAKVADPSLGNEAVLRSYLALVADVRGTPIGSGIEIRQDDVAVLAEVLDLTDGDLDVHLANLLGVSVNDAADVHRRIRKHRALTAAAALTVGSLALLGATNVGAASPGAGTSANPQSTVHMIGVTTNEPGSAAFAPTPAAASAPMLAAPGDTAGPPSQSVDDEVQIGDALVIERGTPPDDPSVQIGDAVTYER
jgi:hypothetical protein